MFIFTKGLGLWRWMREESYQRQRRKMCLKCSNNPSSETISTSWGLWGLLGYMVSWSSGCQVSPGSFSELKSYFMQWKFSRNNVDKTTGLVQWLSRVWLFPTPWTVARKAPLFMGFPRQEYWSGLPFCSPRESSQLRDGTQVSWLAGGFFPLSRLGSPEDTAVLKIYLQIHYRPLCLGAILEFFILFWTMGQTFSFSTVSPSYIDGPPYADSSWLGFIRIQSTVYMC